jgi:hypothetical protein
MYVWDVNSCGRLRYDSASIGIAGSPGIPEPMVTPPPSLVSAWHGSGGNVGAPCWFDEEPQQGSARIRTQSENAPALRRTDGMR